MLNEFNVSLKLYARPTAHGDCQIFVGGLDIGPADHLDPVWFCKQGWSYSGRSHSVKAVGISLSLNKYLAKLDSVVGSKN